LTFAFDAWSPNTIEMSSHPEMPIPKPRVEVIFLFVITGVVLFFVLLAIANLCRGEGLIASVLWLALVTAMIWSGARDEGGLRAFLIARMGDLFGSRFVECEPVEVGQNQIRFGFQLLGRRFVQKSIRLDKIESVEWKTGQLSGMSGRDMGDWQVWVWFDHDDPARAEARRKWHRKPEQDLYGVGPSGRKRRTEALGLSFVSFLRSAGADLVPGPTTTCFVRRAGAEKQELQPNAAPQARPASQSPAS
jgi:hypothetical protein